MIPNSDIVDGDMASFELSRRSMLKVSAAMFSAPFAECVMSAGPPMPSVVRTRGTAHSARTHPPVMLPIALNVNGRRFDVRVDSRTTLLDALREKLAMKGAKKGCDHGQCGACTVLLDGRRINACLTLAVMHDGEAITTIEGLSNGNPLHPMQAAFLKHDGFQCGYCTPGQICSAIGMLDEARRGVPSHVTVNLSAAVAPLTQEEIRERMSGNLCRCSAYPNIVAAISDVGGASS